MLTYVHHASLSNKRQTGLTLVELIVTLVILSLLASVALPYAEITVRRDKELELKRSLRTIRTAIDEFHEDWLAGRVPKFSDAASEDGYPKTLEILVEGVETAGASGKIRRYLRRIPKNPFADPELEAEEQWQYRSYQDEHDSDSWGGQDIFDITVPVDIDRKAINGTQYRDW